MDLLIYLEQLPGFDSDQLTESLDAPRRRDVDPDRSVIWRRGQRTDPSTRSADPTSKASVDESAGLARTVGSFGRPLGTLWHGQEYAIVQRPADARYVIVDRVGVAAAVLPSELGGVVLTRENEWMIGLEHRRGAWAVIARDPDTGAEVAGVSEGWIPTTHALWVGADRSYRLTHVPLAGRWSLSVGHHRLASITPTSAFRVRAGSRRRDTPEVNVGSRRR